MWILMVAMVVGLGLTGVFGFAGSIWKSYNDIPSLVGYMSMALIIYKIGVRGIMPFYVDWCVLMMLSYVVAWGITRW